MTIEERAKAKHINAVAKDFMCAMIGNAGYWNISNSTGYYSPHDEALDRCFYLAEKFVEHELKTK